MSAVCCLWLVFTLRPRPLSERQNQLSQYDKDISLHSKMLLLRLCKTTMVPGSNDFFAGMWHTAQTGMHAHPLLLSPSLSFRTYLKKFESKASSFQDASSPRLATLTDRSREISEENDQLYVTSCKTRRDGLLSSPLIAYFFRI